MSDKILKTLNGYTIYDEEARTRITSIEKDYASTDYVDEAVSQPVNALADGKVDKNQGTENNGKFLGVVDGYLVLVDAPSGGSANAVQYVAQELTEEQQEQVRANIGAASMTEFSALSQEIAESLTEKEASGTADSKVSEHNTSETSHSDIRLLIEGLTTRLNALADSDDTTLDQMSEVVAYIKSNKTLIEAITTNKVSVSDIVDNLTTSASNKPLSAKQGVALKALIDAIVVPKKTSQLTNDSGFLTEHQDISGLAPKATTLSGYGITDGATKEQFNQLSEEIADYPTHKTDTNIHVTSAEKQKWNQNITGLENLSREVADLIEQNELTQYLVDSVEEMTDTTKKYVLKSTGTVWEYKVTTTTGTITDDLDESYTYPSDSRLGSDGSVQTSATSYAGYSVTPFIDLLKYPTPFTLHLEGANWIPESSNAYTRYYTYNESQTKVNGGNTMVSDFPTKLNVTSDNVVRNSDGSGTITFKNTPTTVDGTAIRYIRFSSLVVDTPSVYVTYEEAVTGGAWVDTNVQFGAILGGGVDEETLTKIAELNNEGDSPTTIKLLAQPVLDFYNASAYTDGDYTTTHLSAVTYPCRADIPVPYVVKWNYNEDAMRTTVAVDDTKVIGTLNRFTMRTYEATGLNKFPIYNLLPNHTYYYKVTHVMADGSLVEAKSGSFTTSSETFRLLYIDGTQNVRDLGGRTGIDGQTVKYGMLFRGASFSDSSYPELMLTGKGKRALGDLGVLAELNLGDSSTETSIASNVTYKKIGYGNYATAITSTTYQALFKEALEWIVNCLNLSKPIYMHCQGGCDRTATLVFQLLGLLGVSESDLSKEYELSCFSDIGLGRYRNGTTYDYKGMVSAIKTYDGSTITDKFYNFALDCGISADTITSFRSLMLE